MSIVPTSAVCCEVALLTSVLLMGTSLNWVVARVTAQRARRAREVTGMAPWTARARGSSRARHDPSAGIRAAARSNHAHATARLTGASHTRPHCFRWKREFALLQWDSPLCE